MQPGGDYVFQKPMMQAPIDHLQWFKKMIYTAEALPAGDKQPPNKALQLEWFYMSVHSEDQAWYVESGRRLSNERMLESVAEYFKNIFNLQVADGSLAKKCERQIEQRMRRKMRHELCKRYDEKVRRVTEWCHGGDGSHSRQGNKCYGHDYNWQDCKDSGWVATMTSAKRNRRTRFLLITATKHSSHPLRTDQRASTPPRSATWTPRTRTSIKPTTKNISKRRTTMMRITQVMTMSRALVPIHRPQVRTQHQPPVRAKPTRMRTIIFILIKIWRQVAMCLASLPINSIGASPS